MPGEQSIFCSEADLARVRDGEVTALIRFGHKPIVPGPLTLNSGVSELGVVVTFARTVALMQITTQQMRRAGYADNAAFRAAWRGYGNGVVSDTRTMTVIDIDLADEPPIGPDLSTLNSGL